MNEKINKNSQAKIKANNKYVKKTYKDLNFKVRPEEREYFYSIARKYNLSNAELLRQAVRFFDENVNKKC